MAQIIPVLYEVRPQPQDAHVEPSPWVIMMERDSSTDRFFVWKELKALCADGTWVDEAKAATLPDDCLHAFSDAVTLAIHAVEEWRVDGRTYSEACSLTLKD